MTTLTIEDDLDVTGLEALMMSEESIIDENLPIVSTDESSGNPISNKESPIVDELDVTGEDDLDVTGLEALMVGGDSLEPAPGFIDAIKNSAKLGITDMASLAFAATETFLVDPIESIFTDPQQLFDPKNWELTPGYIPSPVSSEDFLTLGQEFVDNLNKWQRGTAIGDVDMPKTDNAAYDVFAAGVRVASDPTNILFGAPKAGLVGLAKLYTQMMGVGAGAEVGGDIARGVFPENKTAEVLATFAGGAFGPTITRVGTNLTVKPIVQIYEKYKRYQKNPQLVNQEYAGGAAKNLLELAAKEQGLVDLNAIMKEFKKIQHLIGEDAGIPLFIQMSDNPVIQSQVYRLVKTDPVFREQVNKQLTNLAFNIDKKAEIFFGKTYAPIAGLDQFPKFISKRTEDLIKARQAVDNRIEELSLNLVPNLTQEKIGIKISQLIETRKKLVKGELTPYYDKLVSEATKAKIFMSSADTNSIYRFVKENNIRDIFGRTTEIDKKIMKVLEPKRTKEGLLIKPKLSFSQVKSLKERINLLQMKPLSENQLRQVKQLEDVVNLARSKMPGNYNERLKALDLQYYERLGIPFGSEAMKMIGSRKFIEEVVPVILKNASALKQFVGVSGKEGVDLAKTSYNMKIYDKALKNGVIHLPSLKALMKKDKDIIDLLPGMREEIDKIILDNSRVFDAKKRLDKTRIEAENEVSNNFLTVMSGDVRYDKIANRLMAGDTTYLRKIEKDLKNIPVSSQRAVMKRIRRQYIDQVLEVEGGGLKFLTDPKNRTTINRLYGKDSGYIEDLKMLARLSDSIKKVDPGKLASTLAVKELDSITHTFPGLDINYVSSQVRDRISSKTMKAIRILSRINQAKMTDALNEQIKEVLLNPDAVKNLANIGKTFDFKIDNPLAMKKVISAFSEALPTSLYGSTKAIVPPLTEENLVDKEQRLERGVIQKHRPMNLSNRELRTY